MNDKDKKNINKEIDDMNIKSHLNDSLDLSGISVSEDLINRTLEAIKQQPAVNAERQNDSKDKKVIPWNRYVRGFAGVAAAAFIVFAGYNVMNMGLIGMNSKKSEAPNESTNDTAGEGISDGQSLFGAPQETAKSENATEATDSVFTADADINAAEADDNTVTFDGEAPKYTISAELKATVNEDANTGNGTVGSADVGIAATQKEGETVALKFRDICLLAPEDAESIKITDEVNKTSISLTDQIEILDFYTMMGNHQFSTSPDNSVSQFYSVEIKSLKLVENLYTIWIGDNITVRYSEGDITSNSTYASLDYENFKMDLDQFFQEHIK